MYPRRETHLGLLAGSSLKGAARATNDAQKALSEALEAVEHLEARCASAQARELQVTHEAAVRIRELVRELEEANSNGAKVNRRCRKEALS